MRLLERMQPERIPVGRFNPEGEVARFGAHQATHFPASQIQEIVWHPGQAPTIIVNFMGLTGPMGVLPLYYSELIMERIRAKDRTLQTFLGYLQPPDDLAVLSAWEKYRFTVAYERGERDRFSHHLLDLIGLGTGGSRTARRYRTIRSCSMPACSRLHTRSATALRQILADYFEVPVEIEQFVGAWYALAIPDQCAFQDRGSFSEQLGVGAVVGDEIWDQQSGLRIRLGPLTLEQYVDFLPEGYAYVPMQAITSFLPGRNWTSKYSLS